MPSSTFLLEVSLRWAGRVTTAPSPTCLPEGQANRSPKDIPCVLAVSRSGQGETAFQQRRSLFLEGSSLFGSSASRSSSKPDLCAFPTGYPVWNVTGSHRIRSGWEEISRAPEASLVMGPAGNSFSGPHAAGVAAWSFGQPNHQSLGGWSTISETARDLGPPGRDENLAPD